MCAECFCILHWYACDVFAAIRIINVAAIRIVIVGVVVVVFVMAATLRLCCT